MQLPSNTASSEAHVDFANYTVGAAEAWADAETLTAAQQKTVADIAKLITDPVGTLRKARDLRLEAEAIVRKLLARFHVRDKMLDIQFVNLSEALLKGPAGRNRDDLVYREVMQGKTASEVTRTAMREEPELVKRILERYDGVASFPGKEEARKPAADAVAKSIAAREALDTGERDLNRKADEEMAARLKLRKTADEVYGMLRTAFPGRRDMVESFFPRMGNGRVAEEPAPATPTPAPTDVPVK